jgi:hypothetical protein
MQEKPCYNYTVNVNNSATMDGGWDHFHEFYKVKFEAKNPHGCGFLADLARNLLSLSLSLSLIKTHRYL